MWSKHNRIILVKISLLLVMLLVIGLSGFGCMGGIRGVPEGGSGGVIADGTLFLAPTSKPAGGAGCAPPPREGKLIALDVSGGSRLWEASLETSKPAAGGFGCAAAPTIPPVIYGTPAVAGGLVYTGSYSGKIYAINRDSGALRWAYPREGNLQPIIGGPIVSQGKVYFGSSDGKVYALDAATGDKEWEFQTGDKVWSTPAVNDNTLYIGSFDKKLYALRVTDGSKKWESELGGAVASTPLVYNNTVYIGSFDRYFYAIDITNGSLRWKFLADNWFWSKPVANNNVIYAGCLDGKVYALDAKGGNEVVAAFDLHSPISSSPVLIDGSIIIASEAGLVYSWDTNNIQIKPVPIADIEGLANEEVTIHAPLCASDGVVYVHAQAKKRGALLYALDIQKRGQRWSLPLSSK